MKNLNTNRQYSSNFERQFYNLLGKIKALPFKSYLFMLLLMVISYSTISIIKMQSPLKIIQVKPENYSPQNNFDQHRYLLTTLTFKVKELDSLFNIFNKLSIPIAEFDDLLACEQISKNIIHPQNGDVFNFEFNDGKLQSVTFQNSKSGHLEIYQKENAAFALKKIVDQCSENITYKKINISSSLYEDALNQHLPPKILHELINIFSWDVDFSNEIQRGNYLELLYTTYYSAQKPQEVGPILVAQLHTKNKLHTAIRFNNEYYKPDGTAVYKAFIRTPVKYTRISSKFTANRKHPILHHIRAHKGVDYAAPTGTPVKACGDGSVKFVGKKGGYGNTIILRHGLKYTTLYGHLSRFAKNLKKGMHVKQGQIIGYVGQTGLASGPHLHFEFRIFGIHKDPLTVQFPTAKIIAKNKLFNFNSHYKKLLSMLSSREHGLA